MRGITAALTLAAFAAGLGAPAAIGTAGAIGGPAPVPRAAVGAPPAVDAPGAIGAPGAIVPRLAPVPRAASCAGVWVVVDFASLGGGISTACATSHDSGVGALRSAGFAPVVEDGFVLEIAAKPSRSDLSKAYWSYWQAARNDDGSYTDWTYADVGASSSHPEQGDAEGWRYVSLSAGNTPPGAKPPPGGAGTASASTSPATPPATGDPAGDRSARPDATATAPGQPTDTAGNGAGAGSPVGAIVAGSVVLAGAAGLGGWWMTKGRKR